MWELAGIVGIDPGPLTLRELIAMAEQRQRCQWAHTSSIMALVANVNRDPKKHRAFKPSDFDPFVTRSSSKGRQKAEQKVSVSILKEIFIDRRSPLTTKLHPQKQQHRMEAESV